MARRPILLLPLLASLAVPLGQGQSSRSPFLPPATKDQAPAETPDAPLQFCGYVGLGENARYCLYDPATRRSMWLPVGGEQAAVQLQSFDPETRSVTVAQNGRVMTLKLPTARVTGDAPSGGPLPVAGAAGPQSARDSTPNASPADEARRLEAVAAEVRRRRALRQAAAQNQQQRTPAAESANKDQPQNRQ